MIIDASLLRTAFLAYIDTFQNVFRSEINKKFDNVISAADQEQEPWFTDYVTLKPLNQEEPKHPGSSIGELYERLVRKRGLGKYQSQSAVIEEMLYVLPFRKFIILNG